MHKNPNVGQLDKAIRVLVAMAIALLYLFDLITGIIGVVFMLVAIILLVTILFSFCPLYKILGFNSCKFDPKA